MNNILEVLRALAYSASTIRSVLCVIDWWKKYKQTDSEGR